jgi:hypothetical protein
MSISVEVIVITKDLYSLTDQLFIFSLIFYSFYTLFSFFVKNQNFIFFHLTFLQPFGQINVR